MSNYSSISLNGSLEFKLLINAAYNKSKENLLFFCHNRSFHSCEKLFILSNRKRILTTMDIAISYLSGHVKWLGVQSKESNKGQSLPAGQSKREGERDVISGCIAKNPFNKRGKFGAVNLFFIYKRNHPLCESCSGNQKRESQFFNPFYV